MRCTTVRDLMQPFLDGELDVETTVRMLKHLELCRPCRAMACTDGRLRAALVGACREPLGPAERRALVDEACDPPSASGGRRAWIVVAIVAALALLVAVVVATW